MVKQTSDKVQNVVPICNRRTAMSRFQDNMRHSEVKPGKKVLGLYFSEGNSGDFFLKFG